MLKEKMLESDGDNSLIEEFTTISVSIDADTREVLDSHVHQDMYTEREDMYTEREDMYTEREDMYTEREDMYTEREDMYTEGAVGVICSDPPT